MIVTKESEQLKYLYETYFKNRGVKSITPINNSKSVADGTIVSGESETTILVELKKRGSIIKYDSTLIERKKHESLVQVLKLLDIPFYLYVVEWDECYTIYSLSDASYSLVWENMPCPVSTVGDDSIILKQVAFLPYSHAVIISKKDNQVKTIEELNNYIKVIRENVYGENN